MRAKESMVAAGASVDAGAWRVEFEEAFAQIAGQFYTRSARLRARSYVQGLLSQTERKNGWTIAEHVGDASPDGMQRLLNFYAWDVDAVRDDVRGYVVDRLGDPDAVLVVDETGFVKKGRMSAGVQRQYSGTAGRIENCQLGVFLTYSSITGRALIDRELYLPKSWTDDRDRCRAAGVPDEVEFATKPELAKTMIWRALLAGVPFSWIAADEAYGDNPGLRSWAEDHHISYVMAISCNHQVATPAGRYRADALAAMLPKQAWQRLSCGDGTKGQRLYDWALMETTTAHKLLVRRSISDPTDLAYFWCWSPQSASLRTLVGVVGKRWTVEECFQAGKNEVGLDHYQVRKYGAWYRHVTLAMLAHAFLAACATTHPDPAVGGPDAHTVENEGAKKGDPAPATPS